MKKYLLVLILGFSSIIIKAQNKFVERLHSIKSPADSTRYIYPNGFVYGGLIQDIRTTNASVIDKYEPKALYGMVPLQKIFIIKDSIKNEYSRIIQSPTSNYLGWFDYQKAVYRYDEKDSLIFQSQITNTEFKISEYTYITEFKYNEAGGLNLIQKYILYKNGTKNIFEELQNYFNINGLLDTSILIKNGDTSTLKTYKYDIEKRAIESNYFINNTANNNLIFDSKFVTIYNDNENSVIGLTIKIKPAFLFTLDTTNRYKIIEIKNSNNLTTEYYSFVWYFSVNDWRYDVRIKYEYNNDGKLLKKTSQNYNRSNSFWYNYSLEENSYNENGDILSNYIYNPKGDTNWIMAAGSKWIYNENGNLISFLTISNNGTENVSTKYYWEKYLTDSLAVDNDNISTVTFPNPYSNQMNIKFDSPDKCKSSISVYNSVGKKVDEVYFVSEIGINNFQYDNKELLSGEYFFHLKLKSNSKIIKVIKL
jgi:hypothetical protein